MERGRYEHELEGLDDMPAHLKTALTQTHLTLSVRDSRLVLGILAGNFFSSSTELADQKDKFRSIWLDRAHDCRSESRIVVRLADWT